MKKILKIGADVGLVLLATVITLGIALITGNETLASFRAGAHTSDAIVSKLTLPCAVMSCQVVIGIIMVWKLHDRDIHVGEAVGLVLWPSLFYFQSERLPDIVAQLFFLACLIATFGRIRYHTRKSAS